MKRWIKEDGMMSNKNDYWGSMAPIMVDRVGMEFKRDMRKITEPHGLTAAHAMYLLALNSRDGQTMIELSDYLGLDPSNTNRVIKVLRSAGFVVDDRKTKNSKKYSVYLTEDGKILASELVKSNQEFLNKCFVNIPKDMLDTFKTILFEILIYIDSDSYHGECDNAELSNYKFLKTASGNRDFLVLPKDWPSDDD